VSDSNSSNGFDRVAQFLFENSLFLIGGSIVALIWANSDTQSYHQLLHTSLVPGSRDDGYSLLHVVTVGVTAGIGFTVALFVSTAAFSEPGPIQDSAKMGALASFLAAVLAIIVARVLRVSAPVDRPREHSGQSQDVHRDTTSYRPDIS
jgi:Na+/H+ antiporter NhaA